MKNTSFLKKAVGLFTAFALASAFLVAPKVGAAIPYDPNHQGAQTPTFNMYSGTPSVGDEADFLRGKEESSTGYVNNVNSACNNGQRFTLRVYVHNGANQTLNNNGSGPGVAHGTKVKVVLPTSATDNFALNSTISASNASSVSDGMTINCNGKVRKISYVTGTASQYTVPGGSQALSDSIVTTGAAVGTNSPNGDVWGCWDQRVWVTLTVKVEEVPTIPPQLITCDALTKLAQTSNRTVRIDEVKYTISGGATFTNYSINWGDGSTSNGVNLPQSHTYAKSGTYKIVASVNGTKNGVATTVTSDNCAKTINSKKVTVCEPTTGKTIEVEEDQAGNYKPVGDKACTPVTPPTTLVNTGAGDILGLFAAVTVGGALAHRFVLARRNG